MMPSTAADPLRWWQWIGPWPLRPLALGAITAAFAFTNSAHTIPMTPAWRVIVTAALVGAAGGAVLWLARTIAPRFTARLWGYMLVVALAALASNLVRLLSGTMLDFPRLAVPANFAVTSLAAFAVALFVLALLGSSQRRLQAQVDRGDEALAAMTRQAEALLTADEEVRHQVALLLHDRVQAGLIAACLQLRRSLRSDERQSRDAQVAAVVEQLEQLRGLDVRRAVHALSPNLREVDLVTALDDLAETYRPAIEIHVSQADGVAVPEAASLGIYRIVEQCLLNSAVHGHATRCSVRLERPDPSVGDLILRVVDDGAGLPTRVNSGFGTMLIDTWSRVLSASWTRESGAVGTVVEVRLPLA